MTTDIPPPPRPELQPPQPQPEQPKPVNWLRVGGIITALSAPISGLVLYAIGSVLLGEDRLEGENGLTGIGLVAFVIPVLVGLGLLALSFTGRSGPDRRIVGVGAAGLAVGCLLAGVVAQVTADEGDPSIGGGLLLFVAVGSAVAAVLLLRAPGYRPQSR